MKIRRRDFLAAGASAVAVAQLPPTAGAQGAPGKAGERAVGDFILRQTDDVLQVSHKQKPGRILWETRPRQFHHYRKGQGLTSRPSARRKAHIRSPTRYRRLMIDRPSTLSRLQGLTPQHRDG
jgi:hypothetical protein